MKIRFTETALDEVDEILSYIAQHNPSAAGKVADAIRQAVARAAARPESSPVVHAADVRAKLVGRFQYRVYYVVRGDELIIRNVRSTRRQRPWEESGVKITV
jgi:addiction module RelE/StbE family toxin